MHMNAGIFDLIMKILGPVRAKRNIQKKEKRWERLYSIVVSDPLSLRMNDTENIPQLRTFRCSRFTDQHKYKV